MRIAPAVSLLCSVIIAPVVAALALTIGSGANPAAAAGTPSLGAAASFAVLGGASVTNTGPSDISGDLGLSPGTSVTGFPPGQVTNGAIHADDELATQAHADASSAYDEAAAEIPTGTVSADIGGTTVTPGVYARPALALTGTVVLDAQNDPDARFVFQSASTLTTASNADVELRNGANSCNVFWQVGTSATLGANTQLVGAVLAHASITATTGAIVHGRLLAVGAAVTLDSSVVTAPNCTKAPTAVSLSASVSSVRFGDAVVLTAQTDASATGSVGFTDVPTSGVSVVMGSGVISGGVATLSVTAPAFGANVVTAYYDGDATHDSAVSAPVTVQVNAYRGEVIVSEFRASGPAGSLDSYVDLLNTGPPVPLAGLVLRTAASTTTTLPASAGTLGTGRSYLVTGSAFSLGTVATPDDPDATIGAGGVQVLAPDADSTLTDAAGPSDGFHLGTGLSPFSTATPVGQYAWVRTENAGAPVNSGDNAADFQLVSTTAATIGAVQSTLGSPSPTGATDAYQHNAVLTSGLLDPGVAGKAAAPNRVVVVGPPATLTVRRTITNTSATTITSARLRISSISEADGASQPGRVSAPARTAHLRVIDPATATTALTLASGTAVTVHNLIPDPATTGATGGGLNTTLTVPLPTDGLAPGATVNIAVTLAVDTRGTFWFGYDVDATTEG